MGTNRLVLAGLVLGLALAGTALAPSAAAGPETPAALAETKLKLARKAYDAAVEELRAGRNDPEKAYLWSRRWMEAQQDVSAKKAEHAAAVEAHLGRMEELRELVTERYRAGKVPQSAAIGTEFYVAEAAFWLARAKPK